jgi:hypothetical protein
MKLKFIAAALTAICASQANALLSVSAQGLANATSAEASFLATLNGYTTETFEGFTAGTQSASFLTSVGTFKLKAAGSTGTCSTLGYTCSKLGILDDGISAPDPFSGRFGINGKNYLDSFDAIETDFLLKNGFYNSVGFYLTDPNDVNGRFSVTTLDNDLVEFSYADILGGDQPSGRVFYISVYADAGIKSLFFDKDTNKDGYGIDNVTIGNVPEPGSLALLGLGLVGLGFAPRQVKA